MKNNVRQVTELAENWLHPKMHVSLLQPGFGLAPYAVLPIVPLWHDPGSPLAASSVVNHLSEGRTRYGRQELSWQTFNSDPARWWDDTRSQETPGHPELRHKTWTDLLWSNGCDKHAWADSQLAMANAQVDAEMRRKPPDPSSTSGHGGSARLADHEIDFDVGTCRKLCENGQIAEAVDGLSLLVGGRFYIDTNLFYCVLKRCISQKNLGLGRRIHALSVQSGYEGNAFLATHLITLYASHGKLEDARRAFSKVTLPSIYNWASIIFAYARHGQPTQAIGLYRQMRESAVKPDDRIFVAVLKACATAGDLAAGRDVHAQIVASPGQPNKFVQTSLVDMYAKCGSLPDAQRVFDRLSHKCVVMWNAMIAGYAQQGMAQEALSIFSTMQQEGITPPNAFTYACLLQACATVAALPLGKELHAQIAERGLEADVVVGASLINMYAKCRSLQDAQRVFDTLSQKNVVTWTTLIAGYAQQGMGQEALSLYSRMQQEGLTAPNSVTFACLLQACASVAALHQGKKLHDQIKKRGLQADMVLGASLVDMYAKCGSLEEAQIVFDGLSHKDLVTWTAMIAGYAHQGKGREALNLYSGMRQQLITPPDSVAFVCLLQACANVAALPLGKQLHVEIEEQGFQSDAVVVASLVHMYAKCGSLEDAQQVFDSLPEQQIVAWGALVAGYARVGDSEAVFRLVDRMTQIGIQPNSMTFLAVLTVCSHVGLVDKGQKYFEAMCTDYSISPTIEHYTCMVDLLGRAGHLDEALAIVKTMPLEPTGAVWRTLMGACQKWNNVEVGREAFACAVRLDEKDAAAYALMSNIYLGSQMWKEAEEIHVSRKKLGAWKQPGKSSWTDMDRVVHSFDVGDTKHLQSEKYIRAPF